MTLSSFSNGFILYGTLMFPAAALASPVDGIITGVMPLGVNAPSIPAIASLAGASFLPLITMGGALLVLHGGILLMLDTSEEQIGKSKKEIAGGLLAVVAANLANVMGGVVISAASGNAGPMTTEIMGFIDFITEPAAVLAMVFIIFNGIRAVISYGSDQGLTHIRRTILSVLLGLILLVLQQAGTIEGAVVGGSPAGLMAEIVGILNIILGFVTIGAVAVIIWAGLLMIVNIGRDDQYSRAKAILVRVSIGLLIIISSVAIANVILV